MGTASTITYRPMRTAWIVVVGVLFPLAGFGAIGSALYNARGIDLHCTRSDAGGECIVSESLFGITHARSRPLYEIRGTTITEGRDKGGSLYAAALVMPEGAIEITPQKHARADVTASRDALQRFLDEPTQGSLDLHRAPRDVATPLVSSAVLVLTLAFLSLLLLQRVDFTFDPARRLLRVVHRRWPLGTLTTDLPIAGIAAIHVDERGWGRNRRTFVVIDRIGDEPLRFFPNVAGGDSRYHVSTAQRLTEAFDGARRARV